MATFSLEDNSPRLTVFPELEVARLLGSGPLPRILNMLRIGRMVRLSVTTLPDKSYLLERSEALGAPWMPIQAIGGDGDTGVLTDTNALGSQNFYQCGCSNVAVIGNLGTSAANAWRLRACLKSPFGSAYGSHLSLHLIEIGDFLD